MIIFFAGGRLGNQIFQYAFIKTIRKNNEKILVFGFDDLIELFEIEDLINIPGKSRWARRFIFRILFPAAIFISSIRIFTQIKVDYDDIPGFEKIPPRRESTSYSQKSGVLNSIKFISLGYFQSEKFFNKDVIKDLSIKAKYLKSAEEFFSDIPQNSHRIFVHIRRGDYKYFSVFGKSTLLPNHYYQNLIDNFVKDISNAYFIFLSDEPDHTENEFYHITNKKISMNSDPGTDFAIMTKCKSGILSTSTFGWWGAYLIQEKGIIYAPKYWLGFNSKIEFPKGGFPTYAKEVEINKI